MRIATWNVNSIRARQDRLLAFLARESPDVLCLQETKVEDALFPALPLQDAGYHVAFCGQKTYNGVAIVSREPAVDVRPHLGDPAADPQARLIAATVAGVRVISAYVPNGAAMDTPSAAYKLAWYGRLREYLAGEVDLAAPVAVCGDFNVAPRDSDVWDVAHWEKTVIFHPTMRAALAQIARLGLVDVFAEHCPDGGVYSWWDYRTGAFARDRGVRIDMIYASPALARRCTGARIDRDERRGLKPSDHAPVLAEFKFGGQG